MPPHISNLLREKAVHQVGDKSFVFVHGGKVASYSYTDWTDPAVADFGSVHFASLRVTLCSDRQRAEEFSLGIVEIRRSLDEPTLQALQAWIETDKVAMVTGWWGCGNEDQVGKLAERCESTWGTPLYNDFRFLAPSTAVAEEAAVAEEPTWTTCTYFLLFGKCFSVTWPEQPSGVPNEFRLGGDIRRACRPVAKMPRWPRGTARSGVQDIGRVKMKQVDWRKGCQYCLQTSLWLGASVPSVRSQHKSLQAKGKGKGKLR